MKKFCECLSEHEMEIINLKKKKIKLLTKEQQGSYENAKLGIIVIIQRNTDVLRIAYVI